MRPRPWTRQVASYRIIGCTVLGLAGCLLIGNVAAEEEPPDPELLEFVGEFTSAEGEWIDPEALMFLTEDVVETEMEEDDTQEEEDNER